MFSAATLITSNHDMSGIEVKAMCATCISKLPRQFDFVKHTKSDLNNLTTCSNTERQSLYYR